MSRWFAKTTPTNAPRQADTALRQVSFLLSQFFDCHVFRIGYRHRNDDVGREITLPASGVVVVSSSVHDIHAYVLQRTEALAPQSLIRLYANDRTTYGKLLTRAVIKEVTGEDPGFNLPDPSVKHHGAGESCMACIAAFASFPNIKPELYARYRQALDARIRPQLADRSGPFLASELLAIEALCNQP